MEPPAAQPGAAPRPAVRHHFPGHAKKNPTQDQIQKLDTWIPKGICIAPGKVDARGEADHLRIPDLIQICHTRQGRVLPFDGYEMHEMVPEVGCSSARGIGAGCVSRGVAGLREFQGLAMATRWPPGYSRDI